MAKDSLSIIILQKDGSILLRTNYKNTASALLELIPVLSKNIEKGEEPDEPAYELVKQQTNKAIDKKQLIFYDKRLVNDQNKAKKYYTYYFILTGINVEDIISLKRYGSKIIHNIQDMQNFKTKDTLHEILSDYFDGFRNYLFKPDVSEPEKIRLKDEYYHKIVNGHKPSTYTKPILLTCTGLIASGKSTVTSPLAQMCDCVTISSDKIRELFFSHGYNFRDFRPFMYDIIGEVINNNYNVFLDLNISTNSHLLDNFINNGYKLFIIHANPPIEFIKGKILSGNMKHDLTFFGKDKNVYKSLITYKDNHLDSLPALRENYGIWYEVDTSKSNLQKTIVEMKEKFGQELHNLQLKNKP